MPGAPVDEIDATLLAFSACPDRPVRSEQFRKSASVVTASAPQQQLLGLFEDDGITWRWWPTSLSGVTSALRVEPMVLLADGAGWGFAGVQTDTAWLWHTEDWGRTWQPLSRPADLDLLSAANKQFIDGRTALVQTQQTLLVTRDGGRQWAGFERPPGITGYLAAQRDRTGALLVRSEEGLAALSSVAVRSIDDGRRWTALPGAFAADAAIASLWFSDASHGLALAADGVLLATADGGRTWAQRLRLGTQPLGAGELQFRSGIGWLVGADGTVLATRDGGATWLLQPLATQQRLGALFALDAQRVWVGASRGAVFATTTGGQ